MIIRKLIMHEGFCVELKENIIWNQDLAFSIQVRIFKKKSEEK